MLPPINLQPVDLRAIDASQRAAGAVLPGSSELTGRFAEFLDSSPDVPQDGQPDGGEMLPATGNLLPPDDSVSGAPGDDALAFDGVGPQTSAPVTELVFAAAGTVPVDAVHPAGGAVSTSDRQVAAGPEPGPARAGRMPEIDVSLTVRTVAHTPTSPGLPGASTGLPAAPVVAGHADRSVVSSARGPQADTRASARADESLRPIGGEQARSGPALDLRLASRPEPTLPPVTTPVPGPPTTSAKATVDTATTAAAQVRVVSTEPAATGMSPARDVTGVDEATAAQRTLPSTPLSPAAAQGAVAPDVPPPTDTVWRPLTESVSPAVRIASPQPAPLPIDVPVQQPGWDRVVAERVVLMANGSQQNAEIRLTPAELGPLKVRVTVDDGTASVVFQAQHALTRDAIEAAMPRLREMLADSGLSLGQASVHGDGAGQESRGDGAAVDTTASNGDGDPDARAAADAAVPATLRADGLVDTFA